MIQYPITQILLSITETKEINVISDTFLIAHGIIVGICTQSLDEVSTYRKDRDAERD
jgi:hypothetical protein